MIFPSESGHVGRCSGHTQFAMNPYPEKIRFNTNPTNPASLEHERSRAYEENSTLTEGSDSSGSYRKFKRNKRLTLMLSDAQKIFRSAVLALHVNS